MLRSLVITGTILGFIGTSFVPPTVASLPKGQGAIASVLRIVVPDPATTTKRVASVAKKAVMTRKTSAYWTEVKTESTDENLVSSLQKIEWAIGKKDVRLCRDLPIVKSDASDGPTYGDYLALCLAAVTGDTARCDQINAGTASTLRKLCTEELAT